MGRLSPVRGEGCHFLRWRGFGVAALESLLRSAESCIDRCVSGNSA